MRRIVFKGMKTTSFALQKRGTPKVFGYLHNSDNSCTGLSLRSQFLSTLKLPLGNKFLEAVIRFEYTRYYCYYRIQNQVNSFFELNS